MKLKLRWLGIVIVMIGLLGFLTVADDLRHKGELIGVGSIFIAGLIMVGISFLTRNKG